MRLTEGAVYCGYSITFRRKVGKGSTGGPSRVATAGAGRRASGEPGAMTQMVRVDINAGDGSLNGLFRQVITVA